MSTKNKKRSRVVKPKKQIKEIPETSKWGVRINDGFCEYEYIFTGRNDTSVQNVADAIAKHLNDPVSPSGRHVSPRIMPVVSVFPE